MPRQRMIKPDLWTDEGFLNLSIPARLLWLGMISLADDEGRGPATDRTLKAGVFPSDDITCSDVLKLREEICANMNVEVYEVEGREYFQLTKWKDHQKVEHPKPSTLPSPTLHRNVPEAEGTPPANELINELTNESMNKGKREYAPCVTLKPTEYEKLVAAYGEKHTKLAIEKLSAYKLEKGRKYKSDYGAVLSWAMETVGGKKQKAETCAECHRYLPEHNPDCSKWVDKYA